MPRFALRTSLLVLAALSSGCMMASDFGVTPGGAQDIDHARKIIESGAIPRTTQYTPEGLFSQHDFDTPTDELCAATLCPRASLTRFDPVDGSGEQVLVHLALDTDIGEGFERRALNVAVAVDISGSMEGGKLDSTKAALHELVDQLDEGDRMALISFSTDARVEATPTIMDADGRQILHGHISALETEGGTNIEAGLALAYYHAGFNDDGPGGREDRVMLLTDAQPNVGATDPDSFVGMARAGAEIGIGISVFGVGLDLGDELAREVSETRGGNSFYLADLDAIETVFDDEFDFIVSPVAYALEFQVQPAPGFALAQTYGTPDAEPSGEVDFSVATAFLSARGGAMALVLDGDLDEAAVGQTVAEFSLTYETLEGQVVGDTFEAKWLGGPIAVGEFAAADHPGGAKLAVLLDEYLALRAGSSFCEGDLSAAEAIAQIDQAAARLDVAADLLDDLPLREEAELMRMLADNVGTDGACGGW